MGLKSFEPCIQLWNCRQNLNPNYPHILRYSKKPYSRLYPQARPTSLILDFDPRALPSILTHEPCPRALHTSSTHELDPLHRIGKRCQAGGGA